MRLNSISILACVLAILSLFAGCSSVTGEDKATPAVTTTTVGTAPRVGYMAPGFELDNLDGQAISLESLRGQYVMLNFWATWCGPCRMEMPYMQEIYEEGVWADKGVVIAAVNIGESAEYVESFTEAFGLDFTVLLDSTENVARSYNIWYYQEDEGRNVSQSGGDRNDITELARRMMVSDTKFLYLYPFHYG
jgi:peroxiredoxin